MRLFEGIRNSEESSDHQKVLTREEEDHRCIMIIGGINILLPRIPTEASACVAYEEVMQEASREEAIRKYFFKTNSLCVVGAEE